MIKKYSKIDAIPLQGGVITRRPAGLLKSGEFSSLQNVRGFHPGFEKRKGQRALHTTADSTNKTMSLYQFKKNRVTESHVYAQMSDGDILEATNAPPTVTTGVFGAEVFSGTASPDPASWCTVNDQMLMSNGVDQHQIYGGTLSYISNFVVFRGAAAPPNVPEVGEDFSWEVSDGLTTTAAVLDSLDTYANFDCIFFRTPVPCKSIYVTVSLPNGTTSTLSLYYRKSDSTWAAASGFSDGTDSGGATLAVSGTISFTEPTDLIPCYMYGTSGFWYQLRVSAAIDAEVEITSVTFDSSFQDIRDVWDGNRVASPEVQTEGTSTYSTFAGISVDLSSLGSGKKIVISSAYKIEGIYIDAAETPNATGTTLTSLKYWDGGAFVTVGTTTDGTSGMSNSGWLTFPRQAAMPHQFNGSVYAYWYELIWDTAIPAGIIVGIYTMPYFDVSEYGKGTCCGAWKERAVYSFDRFGEYLYVAGLGEPLQMSGVDSGLLVAGDGRTNRVTASRSFSNDLMVWQEEKGQEGGCITIFEGLSPDTFGRLVISTIVGTFSDKTVEIVEGVLVSTETDQDIRTVAIFLSRYGVCMCDGRTIWVVSDDIQNYFDPTETECIRRGYEKEHWLQYDSSKNVVRAGIVSGTSATVPNIFPVLDLVDMTWSFDTPAQELSTMAEIEAGSGDATIVQIGGGVDDGLVYQLNYGTNDVSTAIDSHVTLELDGDGEYLVLEEVLALMKVQASGDLTVTITKNNTATTTKTWSMTAENTNETIRRHRSNTNVKDYHMSVKLSNAAASVSMYLYKIGLKAYKWIGR